MAAANKMIAWDDRGFSVKFLDGPPVDEEYKRRVYSFVKEIAEFEDSLSSEELDELEQEIERKRTLK